MYDVRSAYEILRNQINSFVNGLVPLMYDPYSPEHADAALLKEQLIEQSNDFVQFLYHAVSQPTTGIDPLVEEEDGVALVQFWYTVLNIKLHTALSQDELVHDGYQSQFVEALQHAERAFTFIRRRGKKMTTSLLPTHDDMPYLFWIAWKCRDEKLRRQSANLLRASNKMFRFESEGYWGIVIERVLEIEQFPMIVPDSRRIYDLEVLPADVGLNGRKQVLLTYTIGKRAVQGSPDWIQEYISI